MNKSSKHIMLVAGEASGDLHGAHLVDALRRRDPSLVFSGLGGSQMHKSGVTLYHDLTEMAVVGFWEVLKHYGAIKKIFHLFLKHVDETKPACVILIDYPGFNLRLAKELKKRGIKVIYYISPQVWAWKKDRVYYIAEYVDLMLVLFPFEVKFYAPFGVNVQWVGHPLADIIKVTKPKEAVLEEAGLAADRLTVGLLPGSRANEVRSLLPVMLKAAGRLSREFPQLQFLIIKAPTVPPSLLAPHTGNSPLAPKIIDRDHYNGINACDVCMVASGTATLETAILQKPMVVVYKTSLLTWLLAKMFVKIPDIGLVNVVAGKRIVPECLQFQATDRNIAAELRTILTDEIKDADIKSELKKIKETLGSGDASARAAEAVLKTIE